MLEKISRYKITVIKDKDKFRPKKSEVDRLQCNFNKLKSFTGFKPKIKLHDGLKATYEWYLKNLKEFNELTNKKFFLMIVAEIGLNHMGSLNLLKKYIRKLNQSDVDAITVQIVSRNLFKQYNINKQYFINEKVSIKLYLKSLKKIGLIIDKVTHDTKKYSKR